MEYDLHNSVIQAVAFSTATIASSTTTTGTGIDSLGFESLEFILLAGVVTDGTYTVLLEDSDTGAFAGEEATVDAELVLGAPAAVSATDGVVRIGTITKKRYVRLSIVSTVVTTGGILSAIAVLSNAHTRPTAAA